MQRVLRPCEWFNAGLTLIDGDMPIKESMPSLWLHPLQKIGFPKNEAGHFSSAVSNKSWSDWMSFHTFLTWNDLATNITLFRFRNRVVDGNIENQKSLQKGTLSSFSNPELQTLLPDHERITMNMQFSACQDVNITSPEKIIFRILALHHQGTWSLKAISMEPE